MTLKKKFQQQKKNKTKPIPFYSMTSSEKHFLQGPAPIYRSECQVTKDLKLKYPSIFLVCFRAKNKNVVVYDVNVTKEGNIDPHKPISAYWLLLEPSYQERKNVSHHREELNRWDIKFAWGYETKMVSDKVVELRFNNFPQLPVKVMLDKKGRARAYMDWKTKSYYVKSLYIDAPDDFSYTNIVNLFRNFNLIRFECVDITSKTNFHPETLTFTELPQK